MGCYGSVVFDCAYCGKPMDIQSKAYRCNLDTYTLNNMPASIAGDIDGETLQCPECQRWNKIIVNFIAFNRLDRS